MKNRLQPEQWLGPLPEGRTRVEGLSCVVIGGGLAGAAAATILAERGAEVTLLEKEATLGGRVSAWTEHLPDGEPFEMERGFHAFFRQYYNVRSLLRRVDPTLSMLTRLDDYPILGPDGASQSFRDLPRRTPLNVLELTRRTPTMGLVDLARVDVRAAARMLAFDPVITYGRLDGQSAQAYLDSLRFPADARQMLFDVFAHSFFNPEEEMSAAELLMMFHFYFTGNPEGLVFDVLKQPFSVALWQPLERYMAGLGVDVRKGVSARRVERSAAGFRVIIDDHDSPSRIEADTVVLALAVPALQQVVRDSSDLADEGFRRSVTSLATTRPFAVLRLWLDQPVDRRRAPFAGTAGVGLLDNISIYELLEDESKSWANRRGGSVVELHAYAVGEELGETEIRAELLRGLHLLYPETKTATIVHQRYLHRRDCPAFAPGAHAGRPTVDTAIDGIVLAGDFVRLPFASALMEKAVTSGFMAANHLLAARGARSEPLTIIPQRGLLAPLLS